MAQSIASIIITGMKSALKDSVAHLIVCSMSFTSTDRRGNRQTTREVLTPSNFKELVDDEEGRFSTSAPTNEPKALAIARDIATHVAEIRGLSVAENPSGSRTYFNTVASSAGLAGMQE